MNKIQTNLKQDTFEVLRRNKVKEYVRKIGVQLPRLAVQGTVPQIQQNPAQVDQLNAICWLATCWSISRIYVGLLPSRPTVLDI
jgi:hypothetical protein